MKEERDMRAEAGEAESGQVTRGLTPEEEQSVSDTIEPIPEAAPAASEEQPASEAVDTDDAEVWNSLPRPSQRRQKEVQAAVPAHTKKWQPNPEVQEGRADQKTAPKRRKCRRKSCQTPDVPRKKISGWISRLDLRLLLLVLAVLLIVALICGIILIHRDDAQSVMARVDSGFNDEASEDSGDDAWNYKKSTSAAAASNQSLKQYDGDSSGVTLTLKSAAGRKKMSYEALYKKCISWVVSITVENSDSSGSGTGIVLTKDGYIITCAHVITDQKKATVTGESGKEYDAKLVGYDPQTDLALLKIDAKNLTPAEFGDADELSVGDEALAIGDPLGATFRGTLTNGIISAINRDVTLNGYSMTLIQTTAALNSGNSGGPLLNLYGQVVGMNNMKMVSSSTTVEGLGFAVPSTTAKKILETLAQHGGISRPVLGITCYGLDEKAAKKNDMQPGLVVATVNEKSDCADKGLKAGDLITAINGKRYTSVAEFKEYAGKLTIGEKVTLTVYRPKEEGKEQKGDASTSMEEEKPVEYQSVGKLTVAMVNQQDLS